MFESRLRAFQQQKGQGQKSSNRFASTAAIYRNRTYAYVLEQNKEQGAKVAKRAHEETIAHLHVKRMRLEQELASGEFSKADDFIDDILAEKEAKHELDCIVSKVKTLESQCPEKQWYNRVQKLRPELVGSLAVINHASGNEDEVFTEDSERCECGRVYRFEYVMYMDICRICRKLKFKLVAAEDTQTESMQKMPANINSNFTNNARSLMLTNSQQQNMLLQQSQQSPSSTNTTNPSITQTLLTTTTLLQQKSNTITTTATTAAGHGVVEPTSTVKRNNVPSGVKLRSSNTRRGGGGPARRAAYKKYLMQFSEHACELPQHVWTVLFEWLASIHLLSTLRCRPVPVSKILNDNHLRMYIPQAARITKQFNGDPIPVLSDALIERLLDRSDELHDIADQTPGPKSLPSQENLTHMFLMAENRPDLASAFTTHKTNNVSQAQMKRFRDVLANCAQVSQLSWKLRPLSVFFAVVNRTTKEKGTKRKQEQKKSGMWLWRAQNYEWHVDRHDPLKPQHKLVILRKPNISFPEILNPPHNAAEMDMQRRIQTLVQSLFSRTKEALFVFGHKDLFKVTFKLQGSHDNVFFDMDTRNSQFFIPAIPEEDEKVDFEETLANIFIYMATDLGCTHFRWAKFLSPAIVEFMLSIWNNAEFRHFVYDSGTLDVPPRDTPLMYDIVAYRQQIFDYEDDDGTVVHHDEGQRNVPTRHRTVADIDKNYYYYKRRLDYVLELNNHVEGEACLGIRIAEQKDKDSLHRFLLKTFRASTRMFVGVPRSFVAFLDGFSDDLPLDGALSQAELLRSMQRNHIEWAVWFISFPTKYPALFALSQYWRIQFWLNVVCV